MTLHPVPDIGQRPVAGSSPLDRLRCPLRRSLGCAYLERLIRRGRRDGEFDRKLPVNWMVAATIALGHAAGEEVRAGRMTSRKARAMLQEGLSALFRA
jgi:hypothetical protein